MSTHDVVREINEIRNQLSYTKRIGFFLGAGTSMAIGIPGIAQITTDVYGLLSKPNQKHYKQIQDDLGTPNNIEQILNNVRLIRQITRDDNKKNYCGIHGEAAKQLDIEICNKIYEIISEYEDKADLTYAKKFVVWYNWLARDYTKEIFTTNYDLIIEKSLESQQIPFFDGFLGSNEPFFVPESLENNRHDKPPNSWIRIWKLHGSLGWFWKTGTKNKIVRLSSEAKKFTKDTEIVIYPSKDKYDSSRKQPFISYFDRLKNFLLEGEGLLIISGYSFSDEHINAVILDCLNQNNRLHVISFFYSDADIKRLHDNDMLFPNMTAVGPKTAVIKGFIGNWTKSKSDPFVDRFLNKDDLELGDFKKLVDFLIVGSGKESKIDSYIKP